MLSIFYKKTLYFFVFLMMFSCLAKSETNGHFLLEPNPNIGFMSQFKSSELCTVAENANQFIRAHTNDSFAVHNGSVFDKEVTLTRVAETLKFLCDVYREDVQAKRQSRLHDIDFLKKNFDFYRWSPDRETAQAIAKKALMPLKLEC
jgi:hypothetical protein